MNNNVLVAGAGHGGLSAAYNLAKNGYKVSVYEKCERQQLGHDWLDVMKRRTFEVAGLPIPDAGNFGEYEVARFHSPFDSVQVGVHGNVRESEAYIDRKWLVNYLIDCCIDAGVDFHFATGVKKAVVDGDRVTGLELENGETVSAALVIDACGMYSPVRASLPADMGIKKDFKKNEIFFVHRVYYNRLKSKHEEPGKYNIHFFHCGKKGLDWVITEPDAADLLIGGFGGLDEHDIEISEQDFRKKYDIIGDEIVRGGQTKTIPLRKTLSKIIAKGYAAVGDSASMVEPLSGSGISLSICAGKILADTVIAAKGEYNLKTLWPYFYNYMRQYGNNQIKPDILKGMLTHLDCDDIEYLFQMRFLTDKELGGGGGKMTAKDIYDKVKSVVLKPSLVPHLITAAKKLAAISVSNDMLPAEYDKIAVRKWQGFYDKL